MLHFFFGPFAGGLLEFGIVGKYVGEIARVIARVIFDQCRRLGDRQNVRVDFCRIEPIPGQIGYCPMSFGLMILSLAVSVS